MSKPLNHIREDNEALAYECARLDRACKDLRQRLEQAQARVSQLECAVCKAVWLMPGGQAKADLRDAHDEEVPAQAWLLRKQAEAIVKAAEANGLAGGRSHYALCSDLICDAKEMFEQADELERAGSGA